MELLQQVRIIDPVRQIDRVADVLISDRQIERVGDLLTDYPPQTKVLAASGLVLGTGLVDLYSHSGEPGNESRETLAQLAEAATAGGFTQVGILPDTVPEINNLETITAIKQKSSLLTSSVGQNLSQVRFWGAAYDPRKQQMNALGEIEPEIIGFTSIHDLGSLQALKQILEYVRPWQKPIAIALHHNELTSGGVIREGIESIRYGVSGNPNFSEAAILAAVLEIAAEIPSNLHIMRVTTKRGVELVAEAKARGVKVTASTTWMHLLWDSSNLASYSSNLRLEPPLGNKSDRLALADGVRQGIIDAIAIDHQAYTYEEKTVPFATAPPGVIGLQLALPLLWQRFVVSAEWTALELWQALSSRPRRCLQQEPKAIAPEELVDLVLFDPEQKWLVNQDSLQSLSANTPWYSAEITGKAIETWVNSSNSQAL